MYTFFDDVYVHGPETFALRSGCVGSWYSRSKDFLVLLVCQKLRVPIVAFQVLFCTFIRLFEAYDAPFGGRYTYNLSNKVIFSLILKHSLMIISDYSVAPSSRFAPLIGAFYEDALAIALSCKDETFTGGISTDLTRIGYCGIIISTTASTLFFLMQNLSTSSTYLDFIRLCLCSLRRYRIYTPTHHMILAHTSYSVVFMKWA